MRSTDERTIERIAELRGRGLKVSEVQEFLGVSKNTVIKYAANPRAILKEYTKPDHETIIKLYAQGKLPKEIADITGCNISSIYRHINSERRAEEVRTINTIPVPAPEGISLRVDDLRAKIWRLKQTHRIGTLVKAELVNGKDVPYVSKLCPIIDRNRYNFTVRIPMPRNRHIDANYSWTDLATGSGVHVIRKTKKAAGAAGEEIGQQLLMEAT